MFDNLIYFKEFFEFLLVCGILFNALCVVSVRNGMHSVFFLIFVFLQASLFLFLENVDYFGIIYIIIYVGAVAVLFLFVIMMLNTKYSELTHVFSDYFLVSILISGVFLVQILVILSGSESLFDVNISFNFYNYNDWISFFYSMPIINMLGSVLYIYFVIPFLLSGFILLVAIIGAISLTVGVLSEVKRQKIYAQLQHKVYEEIGLGS